MLIILGIGQCLSKCTSFALFLKNLNVTLLALQNQKYLQNCHSDDSTTLLTDCNVTAS